MMVELLRCSLVLEVVGGGKSIRLLSMSVRQWIWMFMRLVVGNCYVVFHVKLESFNRQRFIC